MTHELLELHSLLNPTKYLLACLSPLPLTMTPELLEVHSLLNPCKGVGSLQTEKLGKEVDVQEAFDETLHILANEITNIPKQQDSLVFKNEGSATGPEVKAKIKDVGKEYTNDESKNIPSCEVCGKIFKKLRWLEHHMKKHLTESEDPSVPCKESDLKVPCKQSEEASLPCNECGKDFSTADLDCHQHIIASKPKLIKCKLFLP